MAIGSKISELSVTGSIESNDYFPLIGTRGSNSILTNLKIKGSTIIDLLSSNPATAAGLDTRITELSGKYTTNKTTTDVNASGKVSKSGDTMTGALILNGAPSVDLQASTKKYVDDTKSTLSLAPIASVFYLATPTIPAGSGFVVANGQSFLTTSSTYSALYAAIGFTYGSAASGTEFKVPDLITYPYIKGNTTVGTPLPERIANHNVSILSVTGGVHEHLYNYTGRQNTGGGAGYATGTDGYIYELTKITGNDALYGGLNGTYTNGDLISNGHTHTITAGYTDDNTTTPMENRPKSLTLLPVIKYK